MEMSLLKALPFGLLLFGFMAMKALRRRAGRDQARLDYPELAQRLGLTHRPPRDPAEIGQLTGQLRGFSVVVDPDEERRLIVRFRGNPSVDLRNYVTGRRLSALPYYDHDDPRVNRFFTTRHASADIAERLDSADLFALTQPFIRSFPGSLKQVNITEHGLTCSFDFGNPHHIPARAVEQLLPVLLDWAELIEGTLPARDTAEARGADPSTTSG